MKSISLVILCCMCLLATGCGGLNSNTKNAAKKAADGLADNKARFQKQRKEIEDKLASEGYAEAKESWGKKLDAAQAHFNTYLDKLDKIAVNVDKNTNDLSATILQQIREANFARFKAFNELKPMQDMILVIDDLARDKAYNIRQAEGDLKTISEGYAQYAFTDLDAAIEKFPDKKDALKKMRLQLEAQIGRVDRIKTELSNPSLFKLAKAIENARTSSARFAELVNDARERCKQLYESWTKILIDMNIEDTGYSVNFKHQYMLVRVNKEGATYQTKTWRNVPEDIYQKHEKHLGLSVAQKPVGSFEEEAIDIPQPPGYAYIAEPGESNTYGEWRRNHYGSSYWYFYPRYGYMNGLFWGRGYNSRITDTDYNSYRSSFNSNQTYYGPSGRRNVYGTDGSATRAGFSSANYYSSDTTKSYNTFRRSGGSSSSGGGFANSRYSTTGSNQITQRSRSSSTSSYGYGSRSSGGK